MSGITINNPYEAVDWSSVEYHKSEYHNHPRDSFSGSPHGIADLYAGEGPDGKGNVLPDGEEYTVFGVMGTGSQPMFWESGGSYGKGWDFSEIDSDYEDRDPEEMGVVAFPGFEWHNADHLETLFMTGSHGSINQTGERRSVISGLLDQSDNFVPSSEGGMVFIAHPVQHYDDPIDESWTRYTYELQEFSREDGLLGLSVLHGKGDGGGEVGSDVDTELWDRLLTAFEPHRRIIGGACDDGRGDYDIGNEVDRRWTTILLHPDEFDPSDQETSREHAAKAFREGRLLIHRRESWDPDTEDPPTVPKVNDITVSESEISIDADNADTIEWISSGEVVDTGEEIEVTGDHYPYVRTRLEAGSEGETLTQAFTVDDGRAATIGDAELGDFEVGQS